jgi:hypothetical protein
MWTLSLQENVQREEGIEPLVMEFFLVGILVLSIALLSGTGSVLLTTDLSTEQVSTFIADLICSQLENQGKRLAPWISVCLHQLTNTWILISLCRGVEYILRITKYVGRSYSRCVGVKDMRDLVDYNLWNLSFLLLNDSNTMSVFIPSVVRGCIIYTSVMAPWKQVESHLVPTNACKSRCRVPLLRSLMHLLPHDLHMF